MFIHGDGDGYFLKLKFVEQFPHGLGLGDEIHVLAYHFGKTYTLDVAPADQGKDIGSH